MDSITSLPILLLAPILALPGTAPGQTAVAGAGPATAARWRPVDPVSPPLFGAGADYEVAGEFVGDTQLGDFDADGHPDLAVSSHGGEITIQYGDGTGSLADNENFWAIQALYDPGPGGIGSADFDGNGSPDLAVSVAGAYDGLGQTVRKAHVYLTDTDRDWTYSTTLATSSPFAIDCAGGDFDEDGRADVAVLSATSGFDVFLGNGDGTFGAAIPLAGSTPPGTMIEAHDVNADGHLDLVAAFAQYPGVRVFWGDGSGAFGAYTFTGPGSNLAVADLNRDGYLDVLTASPSKFPNYTGGLWVYYGSAQPTMTFAAKVGAPFLTPGRIAVADFNGDGFVDVMARDASQRLFLGEYDGRLVEKPALNPLASAPGSPRAGDWNQDGRVDLAFPWELTGQTPQVRVFLNATP